MTKEQQAANFSKLTDVLS